MHRNKRPHYVVKTGVVCTELRMIDNYIQPKILVVIKKPAKFALNFQFKT